MTSIESLSPCAWETVPEALELIDFLETQGVTARFVGGCVRDALIGKPFNDVDIAVDVPPEPILSLLKAHLFSYSTIGMTHGTLTVFLKGKSFQLTSLRRDQETDGRHAVVEYTSSWEEDARRRDFTLNALYADVKGQVWDPCGLGLEDLRARRVRFIGDPLKRIEEDFLRILRFFRFSAIYAEGVLDSAGLEACYLKRNGLKYLSAERIHHEIARLYEAPFSVKVLRKMEEALILKILFPFVKDFKKGIVLLEKLEFLESCVGHRASSLARLSLFFEHQHVKDLEVELRLSGIEKQFLQLLEALFHHFPPALDINLEELLYFHGKTSIREFVFLRTSHRVAQEPMSFDQQGADLKEALDQIHHWERPLFPFTGQHLVAAGGAKDQRSSLIKKVERWWIDNHFHPTEGDCVAYLHSLLESLPATPE